MPTGSRNLGSINLAGSPTVASTGTGSRRSPVWRCGSLMTSSMSAATPSPNWVAAPQGGLESVWRNCLPLGIPCDSEEAVRLAATHASHGRRRTASRRLAEERGRIPGVHR